MDAMSLYYQLHPRPSIGRKVQREGKSLAFICQELLGISLSKELQCSDWSQRPLSEEQKVYAAADAQCLLDMFDVFKAKMEKEGQPPLEATDSDILLGNTKEMDAILKHIIRTYSDKILLDSNRKPKGCKKRVKRCDAGMTLRQRQLESFDDWQGPPPWDTSLGGDGCPKFLCDVMVEGLARHLRCVGIDAAVPHSKKPHSRDLIEQAYKEKRVLLTRDAKHLKHGYLIRNQIYRLKTLVKNELLVEVIETFHLKISEDQLMSRCTKCNGAFIQKPLTTEEAVEAAKGFQVIPNCLFKKNIEFWKCIDCNQLYWEGTQYHNAVQRFIDVCKLN